MPRRRLAALGATAVVLAVGAALLGSRFVSDSPAPPATPKQAGLVPFEDKRRGLSISYPASWPRIASADREVALVAGTAEASLSMRTTPFGVEVLPETIDRVKEITDKLVTREKRVTQLRPPRRIDDLGGLPGWLYIYSFQDPATGQRGAHAHYFLFRGKTMITLVFQTLPSERFATYAPLFDRLAITFKAASPDRESSRGDA